MSLNSVPAGEDAKLIAVPVDQLSPLYKDVKEATDLRQMHVKPSSTQLNCLKKTAGTEA